VEQPKPHGRLLGRRQIGRWALRLFILLIFLAILIQILLWTSIPRRIAISILEQELGLKFNAASLSTGWFGHTTLDDVDVSLPLESNAFVRVKQVNVTHTILPLLMLRIEPRIKSIELDSPTIWITQYESGRWNTGRVAEILSRLGGKQQAQLEPATIALPKLRIENGTVLITSRNGKSATLSPLSLTGDPAGRLVWQYNASIPDLLTVQGRLAPGGQWQHEAVLQITDVQRITQAWLDKWQIATALKARWTGRFAAGHLEGAADVDDFHVGPIQATGGLSVMTEQGGGVRIAGSALQIKLATKADVALNWSAGTILIDNGAANAQAVQLALAGGFIRIDGRYGFVDNNANLSAAWQGIALPQNWDQSGTFQLTTDSPWPGQRRVQAHLTTKSNLGGDDANSLTTQVHITGNGSSWTQGAWTIDFDRLQWKTPARTLQLADLRADFATTTSTIALTNLSVARGASITGRGQVDFKTKKWSANIHAPDLPIPGTDQRASAVIDALGTFSRYQFNTITFQSGDAELSMSGFYDRQLPKPLDVQLSLQRPQAGLMQPAKDGQLLQGYVHGKARLAGTLWPRQVAIDGHLYCDDLVVNHRRIGDISASLTGSIDQEEYRIESSELALWGGKWKFIGLYPSEKGKTGSFRLGVAAHDAALDQLLQTFNVDEISGIAGGKWFIDIPRQNPRDLYISGNLAARDLRWPRAKLAIDQATARVELAHGVLNVSPIDFKHAAGAGQASMQLPMSDLTSPQLSLKLNDWPIQTGDDALLKLTAQTNVQAHFKTKSFTGPIQADVSALLHNTPIADLHLRGNLAGSALVASELTIHGFGGDLGGQLSLNWHDPCSSTAHLNWTNLDLAQAGQVIPPAKGFAGRFSGNAKLESSRDEPHALEPLRLTASWKSQDVNFHGLPLGDLDMAAYLNTRRFVLSRAALGMAGGNLKVWARGSAHEGDIFSTQLIADFNQLNLDPIVHAFAPEAHRMPGLLKGQITLIGNPTQRQRIFGTGMIRITESDLADWDVLSSIYSSLNVLGKKAPIPVGRGRIRFTIENSHLLVNQMSYRNRGVDAHVVATIDNIWKIPNTNMTGAALGTYTPLEQLHLPIISDAQEILRSIELNATTFKIAGTVRQPQVTSVLFPAVADMLQGLLGGGGGQ